MEAVYGAEAPLVVLDERLKPMNYVGTAILNRNTIERPDGTKFEALTIASIGAMDLVSRV